MFRVALSHGWDAWRLSHRRQPFEREKSHAKLMKRGKRHRLFACTLMRPQYSLIFSSNYFRPG
jgi:hypothetical protein